MFRNNSADVNELKARVAALENQVARLEELLQPQVDALPQQKKSRLHPEVLAFLDRGEQIRAIKRYRELTGAGLKEAKDVIDAEQRRRYL